MSLPAPCPCCGHLTLDRGPGDYELCPVCFWEDDGSQLRYPRNPEGANGISLVDAQLAYQRNGAMSPHFKRKVRRPSEDEPLDEGWRPFDPALDWTEPALESDIWPVNSESLYYWRDTYWNGDQHRLPMPPRAETNGDRLVLHLRHEVPEIEPAVAESERRWGAARDSDIVKAAAKVAFDGYRSGDEKLALRVVDAVLPAFDADSPRYAPSFVHRTFLNGANWHDPSVQVHVDRWPAALRDEVRRRAAFQRELESERQRRREFLVELYRTGTGRPVESIVEQLRVDVSDERDSPRRDLQHELMARVISDRRWLYRHPVDSIRIAWRHRSVQSPTRSLAWLRRPRYAG